MISIIVSLKLLYGRFYCCIMNNRLSNYKCPGAKRLMLEAQEMRDKTEDYCAQPIDDNLFEWHFTVRGPPETAFEGGLYHGRLSFPTEYPMKPPSIILLTPNGRFETNKKICLSISGHHPESWQPSWSVRTALLALVAFMPTKANRAIGSLDFSDAERKKLARSSRTWHCETCGPIRDLLKQPEDTRTVTDACEASTSRVHTNSSQCGSGRLNKRTLASDGSDCDDREARDSSADSQSSSSESTDNLVPDESDPPFPPASSSSSCDSPPEGREESQGASGGVGTEGESQSPRHSLQSVQDTYLSNNTSAKIVQSATTNRQAIATEEGRSYPPFVFISITVLLFVLIIRRVVMMVIQA